MAQMPHHNLTLTLALAFALAATAAALVLESDASAFEPGSIPAWVRMTLPQRDTAQEDYENNLADVERMNATGEVYDLVQWGDSITALMRDAKRDVWDAVWEDTGLLTQPLGMGGSTVEELAARLIFHGEMLATEPKNIVLLIGINNEKYHPERPWVEHLGWLLQYMNQTFPDARLALSALIPNAEVDVGPANERLAALADEHGLLFFDCGGDLETGTSQYIDETHLAEDGQLVWISCMKEATRGMWSQEEGVGAVLGSGDGAAGGDRTVYST